MIGWRRSSQPAAIGARRLLLSTLSFAASLWLAELALTRFAPVPDPYDTFKRNALQLNQFIRSEFPVNYRIVTEPEEGLPGVVGRGVFTTNNRGFRGEYLAIPKPDRERRIFVVGGSTVECFYLDDSEALTAVLQKELRTGVDGTRVIRVYGAGKSGDSSDDHVSMIVHRLIHLSPDLIVLFAGINDLHLSMAAHDYLHYTRPPARTTALFLRMAATEFQIPRHLYYLKTRVRPTPEQMLGTITNRSRYREVIEVLESLPSIDEKPRTDVAAYANNIKTLIGVSAAHRIRLVLMTQQTTWNSTVDPAAKQWQWMVYTKDGRYREDYMHEALELLNDAIRQLAAAHSVPLYDLARDMPKSLDFFYDDVHFNERGAAAAGAALARLIVDRKLIP